MEIISQSIGTLFEPDVLIALLVGVVGGMLIGALPGFTAAMGVSLLLPITYNLEAIPALVMLTALYTSAIYGGSITAILIHTPGTPSSAATAPDGFALTKQGRGLEAVGLSTVTSCIGGFLSGIALLTIAPALARISLLFGPAEYFLVAIFGLTVIGSLCSSGLIKGLVSAALGLSISCIGLDSQTSYPRFMYGNVHLSAGLATIPLLIGLFSISQVMMMAEDVMEDKTSLVDEAVSGLKGRIVPPLIEIARMLPTIIRSAVIGILVGILPGAGGDIASYVSVNTGKQLSKEPEMYGKGSLEAIACSETANNAVTGGALIPLLTLSIPGSATAAILLGGFTMHGLVPGNSLFTTQASTTYPIMVGFTLSNIVMGIVGLLVARYIVKITVVPMSLLAPTIIVLATLGSYAVNMSMFDVWIMMGAGFVGYIMRKHELIAAPIVLAVILGPIAESNLIRSFVVAKSTPIWIYYTTRPICIILWILILISVIIPLLQKRRAKKKALAAR